MGEHIKPYYSHKCDQSSNGCTLQHHWCIKSNTKKTSRGSLYFPYLAPIKCYWSGILLLLAPDKSRLAQIKARRRSSVGVRGSPETNSLIRFMAQQRMKTPPTIQTPEVRCFSGYKPCLIILKYEAVFRLPSSFWFAVRHTFSVFLHLTHTRTVTATTTYSCTFMAVLHICRTCCQQNLI